ncbi:MAG TPA: PHB accumulation regulatory domain-containing protein, partial [Dongiaceae bacterium]|nr:PHB accumulation regulatory domain-containing protein [Dongiaceae bacterium]
TLDHLCQMVKDGVEFTVHDAKTGEDITRSVLTQIIVEEEAKGPNLLPINFLRQLIGFYGDNLQVLLPRYLDQSMDSFARNQDQLRKYMRDAFGGIFPLGRFEEMGKQNIALFESAMKMFSPFKTETWAANPEPEPEPEPAKDANALGTLKKQIDSLQKQVEALTREQADKPR